MLLYDGRGDTASKNTGECMRVSCKSSAKPATEAGLERRRARRAKEGDRKTSEERDEGDRQLEVD